MKKFIIFVSILMVSILISFFLFRWYTSNNHIEWSDEQFELANTIELDIPKYNGTSGSWWGHNQSKLGSYNQLIFLIDYDNSNLDNGNSSISNPFECTLRFIDNYEITDFDTVSCNSPGSVLTDELNDKVYFIFTEPSGPGNNGGFGWTGESETVMYEYDIDDTNLSLNMKHIVTPSRSDGKIRQGVTIDDSGNIAIAFGNYSGFIELYLYDYEDRTWSNSSVLSNNDNDTLMYCNVQMLDLDNVYMLCQQDTARDGHVYYQYVKFFTYIENVWGEKMIADYRTHELASEEDILVINSDLYLEGSNVHILTTAQRFYEVKHIVFDGSAYVDLDTSLIDESSSNSKIIELNDHLYYVSHRSYLGIPSIEVISIDDGESLYLLSGVIDYHYIYPITTSSDELALLIYPDSNEGKGIIYSIKEIVE